MADMFADMQELGALGEVPTSLPGGGLVQYLADDLTEPPQRRPWVTTNMVMSMDGAYAVAGRSTALSSPADHELFQAARALCDVVLVGAETARRERYRRPRAPGAEAGREERGQAAAPQLVVVSRSGHLPADQPFLGGEGPEPLVALPGDADAAALRTGASALIIGAQDGDSVDPTELLAALHDRGARRVLCEGGPRLLGQLAAAGLVDEYLLTLSPHLVGGTSVGLLGGEVAAADFRLHRVLRDDDHLMLTYRRR